MGAIKPFFLIFQDQYNDQKRVSNAQYKANKLITNSYKGTSKNLMCILMCFMSIRIIMKVISLHYVYNVDYENVNSMPNICSTKAQHVN